MTNPEGVKRKRITVAELREIHQADMARIAQEHATNKTVGKVEQRVEKIAKLAKKRNERTLRLIAGLGQKQLQTAAGLANLEARFTELGKRVGQGLPDDIAAIAVGFTPAEAREIFSVAEEDELSFDMFVGVVAATIKSQRSIFEAMERTNQAVEQNTADIASIMGTEEGHLNLPGRMAAVEHGQQQIRGEIRATRGEFLATMTRSDDSDDSPVWPWFLGIIIGFLTFLWLNRYKWPKTTKEVVQHKIEQGSNVVTFTTTDTHHAPYYANWFVQLVIAVCVALAVGAVISYFLPAKRTTTRTSTYEEVDESPGWWPPSNNYEEPEERRSLKDRLRQARKNAHAARKAPRRNATPHRASSDAPTEVFHPRRGNDHSYAETRT